MRHPYSIILSLVLGFALMLPGSTGYAQTNLTALTYSVSLPEGNMKDYINTVSWRGGGLEYRHFNFDLTRSYGFYLGWHVFDKKTSGLVSFQNIDLTGAQRRYINAVPALLTGHYYFGEEKSLQVYVGGGAGVYYIVETFQIGVTQLEEENWHFGVAPEVGVIYPLREADLILNGKFNYAFKSGESITGDPKEYAYWGVNIGLAFREW